MARKSKLISEQLREAIKASGLSVYAIAKEAGVAQASILRFMSGERSLTLTVAEKIANVLGLELRPKQ